jgi:hypothetical protein
MRNYNFLPYLSTYIFNNVQLGLIFFVIINNLPLEYAFFFYLSFEIAILLDCLVKIGNQKKWAIILFASSIILFFILRDDFLIRSILVKACCYIAIFFLALALKKIRTLNNAVGKVKIIWRALGYLTCFLFGTYLLLIGGFLILINTLFLQNNPSEKFKIILPKIKKTSILPYSCITLHHLHYFSYAYIIPVLIFSKTDFPPYLFGLIFYIGWAGYYIFKKAKKHQYALVTFGHILSSFSVFALINSKNVSFILLMWFITAIGAGTIILLRGIYTQKDSSMYDHFKTWESFGHLLGIGAMGLAFLLNNLNIGFLVGGISGILCASISFILSNNINKNDI